jgi:hypothetical protein
MEIKISKMSDFAKRLRADFFEIPVGGEAEDKIADRWWIVDGRWIRG